MSGEDSHWIEILSRLGEVQQQLGVVQGQNLLILGEQKDASASRRGIHQKLENLRDDLSGAIVRVAAVETTVKHIAPLVLEHEDAVQQKIGERRFLTKGRVMVAGAVSTGAATWHQWPAVKEWLQWVLKKVS